MSQHSIQMQHHGNRSAPRRGRLHRGRADVQLTTADHCRSRLERRRRRQSQTVQYLGMEHASLDSVAYCTQKLNANVTAVA